MTSRFETFVLHISQIYRCIQKIKSQEMTELGLKGTHVMCLFNLRKHPEGLTAAQLSSLCLEDKAAISRSLSRLEAENLLTLEEGSKRRYRSKIHLTEAGKATADRMIALIERAVEQGGEGLTDKERDTFYKALAVISQNLKSICEKGELL